MTSPVEFTVLGSGTMLPDSKHHSSSHFLDAGAERLLLDCGPGTLHSLEAFAVPWEDLTHIVLSHFHTDHIGDLPGLFFALKYALPFRRNEPLAVVGPVGLYQRFGHLASAFGDHILDPGFEVQLVELGEGDVWETDQSVLRAHPTPHTDTSLCFRWEGEGRQVGYTGDTGPSQAVARFLEGCELVVAECAHADPPENDIHLSPRTLAEMATVMHPDLLLVTHVYPPGTTEGAARLVAEAGWEGRVEGAEDGTRVRLLEDGPEVVKPGTPAS